MIWTAKFQDKVAVVTGACSGIGLAIAKFLAIEGAKVIIADIDQDKGKRLEKKLNGTRKRAFFVRTDVSKERDVRNLFKKSLKEFKKIDILVNDAGIFSTKRIEDLSEREWNGIIDTDLKGAFLCTKHAMPLLKKNKGGTIINISSSLGLVPDKECAAYCAAKAGLNMFTRVNAVEGAKDNIRVNAICPGPIDTPMLKRFLKSKAEEKAYRQSNLMKRFGKPEEVARLALYLASDEANYITGAIIPIDGGEALTGYGAPQN